MLNMISKILSLITLSFLLFACATVRTSPGAPAMTTKQASELQYGRTLFEDGYYKRAMRELLPLACDGIPEAQYAIGYMYYYGYGVAQDTDVGYFWIKRAASHQYIPAIEALKLITQEENKKAHAPTYGKNARFPSGSADPEKDLYY